MMRIEEIQPRFPIAAETAEGKHRQRALLHSLKAGFPDTVQSDHDRHQQQRRRSKHRTVIKHLNIQRNNDKHTQERGRHIGSHSFSALTVRKAQHQKNDCNHPENRLILRLPNDMERIIEIMHKAVKTALAEIYGYILRRPHRIARCQHQHPETNQRSDKAGCLVPVLKQILSNENKFQKEHRSARILIGPSRKHAQHKQAGTPAPARHGRFLHLKQKQQNQYRRKQIVACAADPEHRLPEYRHKKKMKTGRNEKIGCPDFRCRQTADQIQIINTAGDHIIDRLRQHHHVPDQNARHRAAAPRKPVIELPLPKIQIARMFHERKIIRRIRCQDIQDQNQDEYNNDRLLQV